MCGDLQQRVLPALSFVLLLTPAMATVELVDLSAAACETPAASASHGASLARSLPPSLPPFLSLSLSLSLNLSFFLSLSLSLLLTQYACTRSIDRHGGARRPAGQCAVAERAAYLG